MGVVDDTSHSHHASPPGRAGCDLYALGGVGGFSCPIFIWVDAYRQSVLPWWYYVGLNDLHLICWCMSVCVGYLLQWGREPLEHLRAEP